VRRQVERAGAVAGQPAGPPGGATSPGHPHIAACSATALSSPNTTREAVPDRVRGIARAVIHDRSRIVAVMPWAARAQARTNTASTRWRIHRGEQPLPDRNRGHTAPARVPAPVAAGRRTPHYRNRVTRPVFTRPVQNGRPAWEMRAGRCRKSSRMPGRSPELSIPCPRSAVYLSAPGRYQPRCPARTRVMIEEAGK
jgi:hypothetical protein